MRKEQPETKLSDGTFVYVDTDGDLQIFSERGIYIEKDSIPELLKFLEEICGPTNLKS